MNTDLGLPLEMPQRKAVELGDAARASQACFKAALDPGAADVLKQLTEQLAAYRAGKSDLQKPVVPASELYLLVNRFRRREFAGSSKIAAAIAEIDAELATAMPGRPPAARKWA